jgi:hypothetical protein
MPVRLPKLVKSTRGWPWVTYRDIKGITRRSRVLAVGTDTVSAVTVATADKSVTVTTVTGTKNLIATAGVFTSADEGSVLRGNDTNITAGTKIVTVVDATHAVTDTNSIATDAVGTATSVTLRTITATVGTFDTTRDVGAVISGNDVNTGAGRTIASVTDATHATMSAPALLVDAGTATTLTRVGNQRSVKVRIPHRRVANSAIADNVLVSSTRTQTARVNDRRGPA